MKRGVLKVISITVILMSIVLPAFTAANGTIYFDGDEEDIDSDCELDEVSYEFSVTFDTDDGGGEDDLAVVCVDANGRPLDTDYHYGTVGFSDAQGSDCDGGNPEYALAARPITVALFDVPAGAPLDENSYDAYNWIVANGTVMSEDTWDPGDDNDCDVVPVKAPFSFFGSDSCNFWHVDRRLNAKHGCAPLAVYTDGAGGLSVYWTTEPGYTQGGWVVDVSAEAIAAALALGMGPTEQALVGEADGVSVYVTGSGWIKVEIIGFYGMEFDAALLDWTDPVGWDAPVLPYILPGLAIK